MIAAGGGVINNDPGVEVKYFTFDNEEDKFYMQHDIHLIDRNPRDKKARVLMYDNGPYALRQNAPGFPSVQRPTG